MNINDIKIGDRIGFIPKHEDIVPVYWYNITNISYNSGNLKIVSLSGFKDAVIAENYLEECFQNKTAFIANTEQEKLFYEIKCS